MWHVWTITRDGWTDIGWYMTLKGAWRAAGKGDLVLAAGLHPMDVMSVPKGEGSDLELVD